MEGSAALERPPVDSVQTVPAAVELASSTVESAVLQGVLDTVPPMSALAMAVRRRVDEAERGVMTTVGHDAIISRTA